MNTKLTAALAAALLGTSSWLIAAGPAQAAPKDDILCTGSDYHCDDTGYGKAANKSYWTMAAGHNCTNYVAWRLIQAGLPRNIDWLHNGADWAHDAKKHGIPVDDTPEVGAVAQWLSGAGGLSWAGHVAYVQAVDADSITIIEDNYSSGPLQIRKIHRGDPGWPSNFIHFMSAPTGALGSGTVDPPNEIEPLISDFKIRHNLT